jgi:50S ribosomal protein L16 3-hydroxylase
MAKPKLKPGLSALVHPMTAETFIESKWPRQPYVIHDLHETVAALTELPFLESVDALLNAWPHPIQVHLPDVADEASAIDANASDAKKLFSNSMALLFNNVQRISPVLQDWLKAIHQDLGLPTMTYSRCMVYATPDGKGTAPHFDQNVNFILQLTGTKTWWLAPNSHVENPSQRHTAGLDTDPELAAYLDEPLPTQMPEKRKKVVLKPGSLLFVPQGYWHSTEAKGEALSLNFTFSQPSFVDLFTTALRSRLLLSPEWRELADGVTSNHADRRAIAEQKFDFLLMELVQDLPNWNAADILGATEGF